MVKIRDLKDSQLVAKIAKYQKIVQQLCRERDRRIKTKKSDKGLLTPEEIQAKKAGIEASEVGTSPEIPRAQDQDEDIFSISFDEKEVSEARDRVASEIQDKKEEVKKEIGVTKILSLTPEELESLKKGDS